MTDIFKSADWARDGEKPSPQTAFHALTVRAAKAMGARVYEPSTLPQYSEAELQEMARPESERISREIHEAFAASSELAKYIKP